MLVKIEARIPIFPGTDFHFPSTSVPPGTFLGSANDDCRAVAGIVNKPRPSQHLVRAVRQADVRQRRRHRRHVRPLRALRGRRCGQRVEPRHESVVRRRRRCGLLGGTRRSPETRLSPSYHRRRRRTPSPLADTGRVVPDARRQERSVLHRSSSSAVFT